VRNRHEAKVFLFDSAALSSFTPADSFHFSFSSFSLGGLRAADFSHAGSFNDSPDPSVFHNNKGRY